MFPISCPRSKRDAEQSLKLGRSLAKKPYSAQTPDMPRNSPVINTFLDYLEIEKGLSRNTIQSYALDLTRLHEWTSRNNKSLRGLNERDIERWVGDLARKTHKATSISRALSSARGFFQFLVLENET